MKALLRDVPTEKMFVYKTHDAGTSTWAYPTPKRVLVRCMEQFQSNLRSQEAFSWAGEMPRQVKNDFAAKPDNPSLNLRTHKVEEENGLPQVVL